MANAITLEKLIDSIYTTSGGFRKLYAENLLSKKLEGNKLNTVADIVPYTVDGAFGDLYIINTANGPSVSRYHDEMYITHITHIITLHTRDKSNFEFIITYLKMISYACETSEELIEKALIPIDKDIRSNIMSAYECYYTLIGNEVSMRNLFKDLNLQITPLL